MKKIKEKIYLSGIMKGYFVVVSLIIALKVIYNDELPLNAMFQLVGLVALVSIAILSIPFYIAYIHREK